MCIHFWDQGHVNGGDGNQMFLLDRSEIYQRCTARIVSMTFFGLVLVDTSGRPIRIASMHQGCDMGLAEAL